MMQTMLSREVAESALPGVTSAVRASGDLVPRSTLTTGQWQAGLPLLRGASVTLRELRLSDASSLFALLAKAEVSRFISNPPTTVEVFERFIAWTIRQRRAGEHVCLGIVPAGNTAAVGLIQVRSLEPGFSRAERGFALGSAHWGTGTFVDAADLALSFAFTALRIYRLEARVAVQNGHGMAALRKVGAVAEAHLRNSFRRNDRTSDQVLFAVLADDRQISRKAVWGARRH